MGMDTDIPILLITVSIHTDERHRNSDDWISRIPTCQMVFRRARVSSVVRHTEC